MGAWPCLTAAHNFSLHSRWCKLSTHLFQYQASIGGIQQVNVENLLKTPACHQLATVGSLLPMATASGSRPRSQISNHPAYLLPISTRRTGDYCNPGQPRLTQAACHPLQTCPPAPIPRPSSPATPPYLRGAYRTRRLYRPERNARICPYVPPRPAPGAAPASVGSLKLWLRVGGGHHLLSRGPDGVLPFWLRSSLRWSASRPAGKGYGYQTMVGARPAWYHASRTLG